MLIGSQINDARMNGSLKRLTYDLEMLRAAGMEAAELPPHGLDAVRNGRLDRQRAKEVARILADTGMSADQGVRLSVHAPHPINLMDHHEADLHADVLRSSLEFAAFIDATVVVVHAGRYIPEETFLACLDTRLSSSQRSRMLEQERIRLATIAGEFPGQCICLENTLPYRLHSPYCYGEQLELLGAQIKATNTANVRMTLDIGHAFVSARFYGYDFISSIRAVRDLVAHIHVHDNFGRAPYYPETLQTHQIPFGRGDNHMPVGWGSVPFYEVLEEILPVYKGVWIMELRNRYLQYRQESKKNLKKIASLIPTNDASIPLPSAKIAFDNFHPPFRGH